MRNVWMATAVMCLAVSPAFASDCEALPAKGQVSLEKKYMKIKAESAHAATDCVAIRNNDALGTGHGIKLDCRIHFRPRNGGCYVDYTPYGETNKSLSRHPGCDASKWTWARSVGMSTGDSASDPRGKTYTGSVRFNMMNAEYELKYTVLVGDKKSDKALEDTYAATLKKICIRKSS
ncbi:hypothetical protein MXAN_7272 [Myxococcus xanthus DK 1622]|uniref:Lipoprotein n=2 Tax=Myxococcaceae TaxID=31 RepID=Q1CW38_MYXXD|nr:hypothetical protein MXAN_7272 [Myxococcus xanthus DK 1622]QZZ54872.1 hypothetical protein MyxoNM_37265 [Myxococcus xanthus]SDW05435.1 hypothetical protein SAMN05444383_10173 [Myxococcus xanthus]